MPTEYRIKLGDALVWVALAALAYASCWVLYQKIIRPLERIEANVAAAAKSHEESAQKIEDIASLNQKNWNRVLGGQNVDRLLPGWKPLPPWGEQVPLGSQAPEQEGDGDAE